MTFVTFLIRLLTVKSFLENFDFNFYTKIFYIFRASRMS